MVSIHQENKIERHECTNHFPKHFENLLYQIHVLNTETSGFNSKRGPVNFSSYVTKTSLSYSHYLVKVIKYIYDICSPLHTCGFDIKLECSLLRSLFLTVAVSSRWWGECEFLGLFSILAFGERVLWCREAGCYSSYVFGPRGVEMPRLGMLLDKNTYLALILRQVPMSFVKMELGQFFLQPLAYEWK